MVEFSVGGASQRNGEENGGDREGTQPAAPSNERRWVKHGTALTVTPRDDGVSWVLNPYANPKIPGGRCTIAGRARIGRSSPNVIGIVAEYGRRIVSPISSIALWQMGGAVARIGEDDTAFNGRGAGFTFNINGNSMTPDGFDAERQWARDYWSALAPFHTGVYVNFLMDEGKERVRQAYGSAKYDRLKALKRRYDPDNVFRLNQNIPPAP